MLPGVIIVWGLIVVLLFIPVTADGVDPATADALRVRHILKTIETSQNKAGQKATRKAIITQRELNAYIAYRLGREKQPIIKRLDVILQNHNRVRGNIHFDLGSIDILKLVGSDFDLDFDGKLQTRNGAGKLELTSLFLNGESISPQVLDPVLAALARYYGNEPGRVGDWYELPNGIQHIEVSQAEAILYY
jgi:hypothetical protein